MNTVDEKKEASAPTVIVLFGATGDLVRRKIAPALLRLFENNKLPEHIAIVGFSRQDLSNEKFRTKIQEAIEAHGNQTKRNKRTDTFLQYFTYISGEFGEQARYKKLGNALEKIDAKWGVCTNKLFYLAVPPEFYEIIFTHLAESKLSEPCGDPNWTRVIVEKPFGKNLETAQKIDNALGGAFKEEQIYRIDHYLGKEMVQNILAFRFSNNLFEHSWNKDAIEKIEIRLLETIGVEGRGAFYDGIGALRDVGQNHLLQLLALTTMEHTGEFTALKIRNSRLAILKSLFSHTELKTTQDTFRAQYKGYTENKGVEPKSKTETYFKIKMEINTPRWIGMPIILEGGKALREERKEVVVTLKHPTPCLCTTKTSNHFKNTITFHLAPQEGISIRFFSKKPGYGMTIEPRDFTFHFHENNISSLHTGEYEGLLLDVIRGDQTLFVGTDEVSEMWRFVDPIIRAWGEGKVPLEIYEQGTNKIMEKSAKKIKI